MMQHGKWIHSPTGGIVAMRHFLWAIHMLQPPMVMVQLVMTYFVQFHPIGVAQREDEHEHLSLSTNVNHQRRLADQTSELKIGLRRGATVIGHSSKTDHRCFDARD